MPIDGLPLVLENMLLSVFKSHSLRSWNIFDDQNGCVSFRLRFSPHTQTHTSHEIPADVKVSAYRRKSQSQINRDRERAMRHSQKYQVIELNENYEGNEQPLQENCDTNDNQEFVQQIDNETMTNVDKTSSEVKTDQQDPEVDFLNSNQNAPGQNIAAKPFESVSSSSFMNEGFVIQDDIDQADYSYDDTACNLVQLRDDVHEFSMECLCLTCLTEASKRSWEIIRKMDKPKSSKNDTGT